MPFFEPRIVAPKDWGTELLIAHTDQYIGKVLSMRAGTSGPLQFHERKEETFHLWAGKAELTTEVGGRLVKRPMSAGMSYHVPPGTIHRVRAKTACIFFEASTPVFEDRVNVEDRFRSDPNF